MDGNVWYLGESVKNYEDGKLVDKDGSWLAGVDGGPGIIMMANPIVGVEYNQENAPPVAQDFARVEDLSADVTNVPYATSTEALQTFDSSRLTDEPPPQEQKFYMPGVGWVYAQDLVTGEVEKLVSIEFDGTAKNDVIIGNIGPDVLRGHGGDDRMDGGLGKDTMIGGPGRDTFAFNSATETGTTTPDVITDFNLGKDKIDVSNMLPSQFSFIGNQAFHATAGELRYEVTQTGILVQGDLDGNGAADFAIELQGISRIGVGDFIL
jgi:Ca2+-binding RTX toxin-like protein